MANKFSPQFKLDDLYISPFTAERYFDAHTGKPYYKPIERNVTPTGVHMMDQYLLLACTSRSYTRRGLEAQLGVRLSEFSVMCRLLSGVGFVELQDAIRLRLADDLLRYTSLELRDIALRCGFANNSGLSKFFYKKYKCTPGYRQRCLRSKNDEGRFRL